MLNELSCIVREVGNGLLELRKTGGLEGKWEGRQYKAKADKMANEILSSGLKRITPDIAVISEEDPDSHALQIGEARYWLIDPIDGTASFAEGYPGFVTQAALIIDQSPAIAAVFSPVFDLMYLAERRKGAYCNGSKLSLMPEREARSIIDNYPKPEGVARALYDKLNLSKYIECGSIGLKICRIADGTADLFVKDVTVKGWDLAAPHLILEESGGILTDSRGRDIEYPGLYRIEGVVAAPTREICKKAVEAIKNIN